MKIIKKAKTNTPNNLEELYKDLKTLCGRDPVIEMFNIMAADHNFPPSFVQDMLWNLTHNQKKSKVQLYKECVEKIIKLSTELSEEEFDEIEAYMEGYIWKENFPPTKTKQEQVKDFVYFSLFDDISTVNTKFQELFGPRASVYYDVNTDRTIFAVDDIVVSVTRAGNKEISPDDAIYEYEVNNAGEITTVHVPRNDIVTFPPTVTANTVVSVDKGSGTYVF